MQRRYLDPFSPIKQNFRFWLSFIVACLFCTQDLYAGTVYKHVAPDGTVTYSDVPSEGEPIEIAPITTVPAVKLPPAKNKPRKLEKVQYYKSIKILKPANDSAFFSGDGKVEIEVTSTPNVKGNDNYVFLLDGKVVATQKDTKLVLKNVNRGTHTLTVNIVSTSGQFEIGTQHTFSIQRPRVRPAN